MKCRSRVVGSFFGIKTLRWETCMYVCTCWPAWLGY
jgi:hypothetical protein